ncbi:MAG: glycosyltransferase family 2 protein [Bacteroidetes bacterium]|nr:glycosyltransferase family 2 protein [Bacteroidota bacterium]
MEILFAVLLFIVFYSYVGYGMVLYALVGIKKAVFKKQTNLAEIDLPSVTLLIAAYNEENEIEEKILNSFELQYPKDKLHFLFVTDGSTDKTVQIVKKYDGIHLLHETARQGKTAAVNRAMKFVSTDVVVFSDANTMLNKDAVLEIVKHYANPKVGCVSGEKRVRIPETTQASAAGEGLYWKYESKLKQWDAELYSTAGAAGELFSIRTNLFVETESDTILDDFMISLRIVEQGYTIAYEANAYALENSSSNIREELKRKIRICAGGFQSIIRLAALWNVFNYGIFTFQYVSHRVLRWTIAPLALFLLIPLNLYLAFTGPYIYQILLAFQVLFYGMAFIGWKYEVLKTRKKLFFVPFYFTMMNYSVFVGFKRFIMSEQSHIWQKAKRAF